MPFRAMFVLATLGLAACSGDEKLEPSKPSDPSVTFDIPPPNVNEDWPCPPFGTPTTEEDLADDDGDLLANCQELTIGTNPDQADTDGDGLDDYEELGDGALIEPLDTDGDDLIDSVDDDDDDDSVPSVEEIPLPDHDADGIPNHLDEDDDNDDIVASFEDADGDGDVNNDDGDGDGVPNWLDRDDDNDGVNSEFEHTTTDPRQSDADDDGIPDYLDPDDDGDGLESRDEDADGDGDPTNDDLDADGVFDFQDIDEDGDGVPFEDLDGDGSALDHDSDGDGILDYRDDDDDNDGVTGAGEADPAETDPVETRVYDLDGDGRPNYRDANDDGDGCTTLEEDADGDGDPTNDNTIVDAGDYDPADYLDPAAETCASPQPEPEASWSLLFVATNLPPGSDGATLLLTIDDGTPPVVHVVGAISPTGATLEVPGAYAGDSTVDLAVTVDLDNDLTCDAGGPEEAVGSFVLTGLVVTDYDVTLEVDFTALTADPDEVTVTQNAAACAAHP
jgi:hypothetical protein